jgi:8-oxo-dGTP pyrophosphatase MutT (NUDIX family)
VFREEVIIMASAVREVREETGLEIELIYQSRFGHPRVREVPLPFAIH